MSMSDLNKQVLVAAVSGLGLMVWQPSLLSFPAPTHFNGAGEIAGIKDLMGTPVSQGGLDSYPTAKINSVGQWMDNPARKTGQYVNRTTGTPVHPTNHGHLRHNPLSVERVFKNSASKNVARMHKIQDVFNNKAGVDGWKLTPRMKKEAEVILRYTRRFKRLPDRLPEWVDNSGPLIDKTTKIAGRENLASKASKIARSTIKPGTLAAIGAAITLASAIHQHEVIEDAYARGEIDDVQRRHQHTRNTFTCGGRLLLATSIVFIPAGTPVLVVVAGGFAAYYVMDCATGKMAEWYNQRQDRKVEAATESLADSFVVAGEFEVCPETMRTAGVRGKELAAYIRAYNVWQKTKQSTGTFAKSDDSAFDAQFVDLRNKAEFYGNY